MTFGFTLGVVCSMGLDKQTYDMWASQVALVVKNPLSNATDVKMPVKDGSRRSPGGGHGNPLQYSCLENLIDRGAWQATVLRATQTWT